MPTFDHPHLLNNMKTFTSLFLLFIASFTCLPTVESRRFRRSFSPLKFLDPLGIFSRKKHPSTEGPVIETKFVSVEETVFRIGPEIQDELEASGYEVTNYMLCPLCTVGLLGQLLLGTHGNEHKRLEEFLNLKSDRGKRDIQYFELSNNPLHDTTLYNPAFHWKIKSLLKQVNTNQTYKAQLESALLLRNVQDLAEHFKKHLSEFYATKVFNVGHQGTEGLSNWTNFKESSGKYLENSAIYSQFTFKSTWKHPFQEEKNSGTFKVPRSNEVAIKYLQGIAKCVYADNRDFTIVGIPLKDDAATVYILLYKTKTKVSRHFYDFLNSEPDRLNLRDVKIRIPNIFSLHTSEIDLGGTIFKILGFPKNELWLNRAAENLIVTNLVEQISASVTNEENQNRDESQDDSEAQSSLSQNFTAGEVVTVNVDAPFDFCIIGENNKIPLVLGRINDPRR